MKSKHTLIPMLISSGVAVLIIVFATVYEYKEHNPPLRKPVSFKVKVLKGLNKMIKVEQYENHLLQRK